MLVGTLGPAAGRHLYAVVHGHTPARVVVGKSRGSIGAQRALGHGPHATEVVRAALLGLVDRVCRRLRKAHRVARTVVLRLRFEDYTKATRSRSFAFATDSGEHIAAAALALLAAAGPLVRERGITLVGVALGGLESDAFVQPELLLDGVGPRRHRRRGRRGRGAVRHPGGGAREPAAPRRGPGGAVARGLSPDPVARPRRGVVR